MIIKKLKSILHPEQFQGWGKKKNYFEGWYFKVLDRTTENAYAFIPGISFDNNGDSHAFIQLLNGKTHSAKYHRFQFNKFHASSDHFEISIGENVFSDQKMKLDLPEAKGEIFFHNTVPWPDKWYKKRNTV